MASNEKHIFTSKQLVGLQAIGPSSFNQESSGTAFSDAMWKNLISQMSELNLPLQRAMYGVSWPADEKTPPDLIHYFVGFESNNVFEGEAFDRLDVESGNYFKYTYRGPASEVDRGFQAAYMIAFPASGLTSRSGKHIEVYPEDIDMTAMEISFEILIPVE